MIQDLRFAIRGLRRNPGFACVAILVLALGTGANTAIFGVFNAALLRPLPFHDPDQVMLVSETIPSRGIDRSDLCAANFYDLQHRSKSFISTALYSQRTFTLVDTDSAEAVSGAVVSSSFFDLLGVSPLQGRDFRPEDDVLGSPGVAILSYEFWKRHFGGNDHVIGKDINLNGHAHTVVGIMPNGFQALSYDQELWTPIQLSPQERSDRTSHYLWALGRLNSGVSLQRAQAELNIIASSLQQEFPKENSGRGLRVAPLHEELVGETRPVLFLLMGAADLVLLIACVNVTNLLSARALSRRKEIGTRLALGANTSRLLQQLLLEGLALAVLGLAAGLLVGYLSLRALPSLVPAGSAIADLGRIKIDGHVLLLELATATLACVAFACVPAWQLFKATPGVLAERSAASTAGGRHRLRSALLAIQVALSLALLLCAGLVLRSLTRLMHVEPGFKAGRVLTAELQMPAQQVTFFRQIEEQLRGVPGVEGVGAIEYLPLTGSGVTRRMLLEGGSRPAPGDEPIVERHIVTADYFRSMAIPLKAGHGFQEADLRPQPLYVVINETMARRYWPAQNPIGQYLRLGTQATVANAPLRQVVGIVGDVKYRGLKLQVPDQVYVPLGQDYWPVMHLTIRAATDPNALIPAVKKAVWTVDKNQPLPNMRRMDSILADSVWQPRLDAVVLSSFALLSLSLALAGIYGLMAQVVGDRTPEIGIRVAIGASPQSVLLLMLKEGFVPVTIGAAAGIAIAVASGRLLSTQLFGVGSADPATFVVSIALALLSSFSAMLGPAFRAAHLNPVVALRNE